MFLAFTGGEPNIGGYKLMHETQAQPSFEHGQNLWFLQFIKERQYIIEYEIKLFLTKRVCLFIWGDINLKSFANKPFYFQSEKKKWSWSYWLAIFQIGNTMEHICSMGNTQKETRKFLLFILKLKFWNATEIATQVVGFFQSRYPKGKNRTQLLKLPYIKM